jgi:hypothetical protein
LICFNNIFNAFDRDKPASAITLRLYAGLPVRSTSEAESFVFPAAKDPPRPAARIFDLGETSWLWGIHRGIEGP